jgi:hypothetical protein
VLFERRDPFGLQTNRSSAADAGVTEFATLRGLSGTWHAERIGN